MGLAAGWVFVSMSDPMRKYIKEHSFNEYETQFIKWSTRWPMIRIDKIPKIDFATQLATNPFLVAVILPHYYLFSFLI